MTSLDTNNDIELIFISVVKSNLISCGLNHEVISKISREIAYDLLISLDTHYNITPKDIKLEKALDNFEKVREIDDLWRE